MSAVTKAVAARAAPWASGLRLAAAVGLAMSFSLTFTARVHAQHMNEPHPECSDVGPNVAITNCFDQQYKRADAELNEIYRRIMTTLGDEDKESLRAAQRAWIVYRDKACAAEAAPYQGGSAMGTVRVACLEAATRERMKFLKTGFWWRVEKFAD
ncbi:MAG: lysozyme inhibitor LprI family protein [Parvularcula sp.]|jgi:uncharacterized protein YecT (DUF1311 family)|nr:lysozyme inhibitor LprI family protein [Parvularcula sp.]